MSESKVNRGQESNQLPATVMEMLVQEERHDARWTRWAIAAAVALHVGVFAVHWPSFASEASDVEQERPRVYVMKIYEFKPPPPREVVEIKPPVQRVFIPDADPDGPEEYHREESPVKYEVPNPGFVDPRLVEIPPPAPEPSGPVVVGVDITAPEKVFAPNPHYPEVALRIRYKGTVILKCVIDSSGQVVDIEVLRPEPYGLTEAAVAAVKRWRFEPSTLNGKPVDVIYTLSVRFVPGG
jgi:protein TonB